MSQCSIPQPTRRRKFSPQRCFLRHDPKQMNAIFPGVCVVWWNESEKKKRIFLKWYKMHPLKMWVKFQVLVKITHTVKSRLVVVVSRFSQFLHRFFFNDEIFSHFFTQTSVDNDATSAPKQKSLLLPPTVYWRFRFFYAFSPA